MTRNNDEAGSRADRQWEVSAAHCQQRNLIRELTILQRNPHSSLRSSFRNIHRSSLLFFPSTSGSYYKSADNSCSTGSHSLTRLDWIEGEGSLSQDLWTLDLTLLNSVSLPVLDRIEGYSHPLKYHCTSQGQEACDLRAYLCLHPTSAHQASLHLS